MNSDSENNPRASGETSTKAPPRPQVKLPARESEAEFLRQQARESQAAMRHALADIITDTSHAIDPRLWTKEHPWATLGTALVSGFALASALIPDKRSAALRRLEKIEEALAAGERNRRKEEQKQATKEALEEEKPSTGGQFVKQLIALLQPAIVSAIAAGVRGKMEQQQHQGNGHDPHVVPDDLPSGGL